jgi:hypothetical protein
MHHPGVMAVDSEQRAQALGRIDVVIDDEDPLRRAGRDHLLEGMLRILRRSRQHRQADHELAALLYARARRRNPPAVQFDDAAHECEPNPQTRRVMR